VGGKLDNNFVGFGDNRIAWRFVLESCPFEASQYAAHEHSLFYERELIAETKEMYVLELSKALVNSSTYQARDFMLNGM